MKKILICILVGLSIPAISQDYQQEYLQGKEFLRDQKYSLAMEVLKPLVSRESDSQFSNYAMYYYAIAAYRDGSPALAKNMFLQIREVFPQWDQLDEVNLWLGKLYFEDKKYNQAINVLSSLKGNALEDEKAAMLKVHLAQIKDTVVLNQLYTSYNTNKFIAERYAQVLAQMPLGLRNQEKLNEIIERFNFSHDSFNTGVVTKTEFKDSYKVAVLLPFVYQTLDVDIRKKKNQFVLDIYQGIRMALDKLKNMGIPVEVFTYDTERDYTATQTILEKDELKGMDLIIGPLYPEPLQLVQQFAFENKINIINPVSNNLSFYSANPFYFLFKPSYSTQGMAMAEYTLTEVSNPYGIIFYGDSEEDSLLANSYKETFERDSLHKIVLMEKIDADNERRVIDVLTTSGVKLTNINDEEEEVELTIAEDSIGSVYVASDEGLIITRVLSGIEARKDSIQIIGSERWMEIGAIDYAALERLKVAMSAPTYFDYNDEDFQAFRSGYIQLHKERPSEFALIGYDLMMFAGHALKKYGKYFQVGMRKNNATMEGFLLSGYNYLHGNDNHVVPIVQIIENEPQVIVIKNYGNNEQK